MSVFCEQRENFRGMWSVDAFRKTQNELHQTLKPKCMVSFQSIKKKKKTFEGSNIQVCRLLDFFFFKCVCTFV